jgi:hypothetical protein
VENRWSCWDKKAVKFQVKIDPSALEKTHYQNITMHFMKNLALANAVLSRYQVEGAAS